MIVLIGVAYSLTALIIYRLLLGIAQGGAYATTAGFLKHWIPIKNRGTANSSVSMGGRAGALLSNFLTPQLMVIAATLWGTQTGQWRVVFMFYGLLGFFWSFLFYRWFRNVPAEHAGANLAEQELIARGRPSAMTLAQEREDAFPWIEFFTNRNLWLLSIVNIAVNVGWIFLATWLPTYLKEVHGSTLAGAGALTALTGLAGMVGCITGGVATDQLVKRFGLRWGRRLPALVGGAGAATAYVVCLGTDRVEIIIAMMAAVYFFTDLVLGTLWSTYQDTGGAYVGTMLGFANMCGNLAAAVIAVVIGEMAEHDQWTEVFMMSSGSFLVAMVCWLFVDAQRPIKAPALTSPPN
jgi:ACS family glucarate transporter-like MFS transporter